MWKTAQPGHNGLVPGIKGHHQHGSEKLSSIKKFRTETVQDVRVRQKLHESRQAFGERSLNWTHMERGEREQKVRENDSFPIGRSRPACDAPGFFFFGRERDGRKIGGLRFKQPFQGIRRTSRQAVNGDGSSFGLRDYEGGLSHGSIPCFLIGQSRQGRQTIARQFIAGVDPPVWPKSRQGRQI